MPKVTIEVPEGFEEVVKELEQTLQHAQKGVEGAKAGDMAAFDTAWQGVNAGVEESERQLKRRLLRVLDVDAPQILIDGKTYSRVGRYEATYKTRQGPVDLVDFWHLMEKLGLAAVLLHGALAPAVLERWKLSLLNRPGAVWQVLTELHESGKRHQKSGEAMPVHDAITYLENHGGRMGYAPARQRGLPIGSGTVEAACKSLVALRMKRPGSRWKEPSGQHILDLRSLVLSDRWQPAMQLALAPLRSHVQAAA
jgi:hypothetical protein